MYTDWHEKNARMTLLDIVEKGNFSLVIDETVKPATVVDLVNRHSVGNIVDLSPSTNIEDALVEAGYTVCRVIGTRREDLTDFINTRSLKRQIVVIKMVGSVSYPESLPQERDLNFFQVAENVEVQVKGILTKTFCIFVEIDPTSALLARIVSHYAYSAGRMARQHVLLVQEQTAQAMRDFNFKAYDWATNYNVRTVIVRPGEIRSLLTK